MTVITELWADNCTGVVNTIAPATTSLLSVTENGSNPFPVPGSDEVFHIVINFGQTNAEEAEVTANASDTFTLSVPLTNTHDVDEPVALIITKAGLGNMLDGVILSTIIEDAGDLIAGTAPGTTERLAIGTAGQYLTVGGANPSGLEYTDPPTSLPPDGAAGGDLEGDYPDPTVASIQGVVISGTPSADDVLKATSDSAATWAPESGGSGDYNAPYFMVVENYGALVDGLVVQDGVMTASSADLACTTSTPFSSGDVGKSISVVGAGAGGDVLVTTILTFTNSGHVVLAAAASTDTSAAQVIFGTDDTAAWNNAMADIQTAGTGIAYCSKCGISVLATAPTLSDAGGYGVINLPVFALTTGDNPFAVVGIMGPVPPAMPFAEGDYSVDNQGTLVLLANGSGAQSNESSAAAVVNGGTNSTSSSSGFNQICFIGRNFIARTPMNSPYHGVFLEGAQQADLEHVSADVQTNEIESMTEPTNSNTGIVMPTANNGAHVRGYSVAAIGYETGQVLSEHFDGDELVSGFCQNGYNLQSAPHAMHIGRMGAYWNINHVTVSNAGGDSNNVWATIDQLDVEAAASGWYGTVYDIKDPDNLLYGSIYISQVLSGTGQVVTAPVLDGAIHVGIEVIGGPGWVNITGGPGYINSWTDYSGLASRFRKDATGTVELQIAAQSGGGAALAFTLPAGFRIGQSLDVPANDYDGSTTFDFSVVNLSTNGDVQLFSNSTTPPTSGHSVFCIFRYVAEG